MNKRRFLFMWMAMPLLLHAQTAVKQKNQNLNQGIRFTQGLTWKQVLKKAKQDDKYIFMDCYATWCGPCKQMESDVFTKQEVGDYFNKNYISVRLQMDKTSKDNQEVRDWYKTVEEIAKAYGISAYPTLLFFAPNGELMTRSTGYYNDAGLIETAKTAMQPGMILSYRVYYSWLGQYQAGKRDYTIMAELADTALQLKQNDIAYEAAKIYRPFLLDHKDVWLKPSNLYFMAIFLQGSRDPFFQIFIKNGSKVDSILQEKGLAQYVVDKVIQEEEIEPITKPVKGIRISTDTVLIEKEPNWEAIHEVITAKYGVDFANRNILQAKIQWYYDHHKWGEVARYITEFGKIYHVTFFRKKPATFFSLNSAIWRAIFKRSVDKVQIDVAIKLMEQVVMNTKGYSASMDTYANLLYKAGQREKAIKYQEKALSLEPDHSGLIENLMLMKKGLPTWPHYISNDFWDEGLREIN